MGNEGMHCSVLFPLRYAVESCDIHFLNSGRSIDEVINNVHARSDKDFELRSNRR
jgi:hypothetical protein